MNPRPQTISLDTDTLRATALIGGKAASLIESKRAGFTVPDGWALTAAFFDPWADEIKHSPSWSSMREALHANDVAGLRSACAELEHRAQQVAFTPAQHSALTEVAASLAAHCVVVRSSSPEEDLSGASFAGLYRTVLNVAPSALEPAVRACFASCLHERVLLYKREKGLSFDAPRFAAIVQVQLASEVSGVAISIDPLSNDFDRMLINAIWGLGEPLVSGAISPDTFILDKSTGRVLQQRPGVHDRKKADAPCLDEAQVAQVFRAVKTLEALYDFPVDVEWSFAGSALNILQLRPVTAYIPLAEEMLTAPGRARLLYLDAALSKGMTTNAPMTPMTSDLFLRLYRIASQALLGKPGDLPDLKTGLFGVAGGRLYLNFSNVMHLVDLRRSTLIDQIRLTDAITAEVFATRDLEMYRPQRPPPFLRPTALFFFALGAVWRIRRLALTVIAQLARRDGLSERSRRAIARFDAAMAEPPDRSMSIDELMRHDYTLMFEVAQRAMVPALMLFFHFGTERLMRLIDRGSTSQRALADAIKRGYTGDLVVEMGAMMHRLSVLLPQDEFEDVDQLARKIERRALPEAFLSVWDEFVRRFGCRGPMEMEIAAPKYADDARLALRQIAVVAKGEGRFDPQLVQAQHVREREAAYMELRAQLPRRKRRALDRCYRNIVEFGGMRDTPKHYLTIINRRMRERVLMAADALVASGRLRERTQVFELTLEDLSEAERDSQLDLQRRIDERGRDYRRAKAFVKQFPPLIDSRGRIVRPNRAAVDGELSGVAVSPGVARGPVRILHGPFDAAVAPGDVLVAYMTDPGWTPLFINAAAIVLEVGGELQHGALVAREYGKPCVVGIDRVTTRLRDGELVEVDGHGGVVRSLDRLAQTTSTLASSKDALG